MIKFSESKVKPSTIKDLGDGTIYYRFNIREKQATVRNRKGEETTETHYAYDYILLRTSAKGKELYREIVKALIKEHFTIEQELDLINSYNNFKTGLVNDESAEVKYLEYVDKLKSIKDSVKQALEI